MKQLSDIKRKINEALTVNDVPDPIRTTVAELPGLMKDALEKDYTISIYEPFKRTPIAGVYKDVVINPHEKKSKEFETTLDAFVANLNEYYSENIKIDVRYYLYDKKYILMSIYMATTFGDKGSMRNFLDLNPNPHKVAFEVTAANTKKIAEFIEGRTGDIVFENIYHNHYVRDISDKEAMEQVNLWAQLDKAPEIEVTREGVDYMRTKKVAWFHISLPADERFMTPEQWEEYSGERRKVDDAICAYYASKSGGGYTGD